MSVISFKDSFLPKKIKKYLDENEWEQIKRIIIQGVPLDLKIDEKSFWESILYTFNKKFPSKRGLAKKIPKDLQDIMTQSVPSGFLHSKKTNQSTPVTISAFYGQWDLVEELLKHKKNGGEVKIDSSKYSIWSSIMDGYLHRVGIKNYRYPSLENDYVSILAKRVADDERSRLIDMVGKIKPHATQWPGVVSKHENFFMLTSIMTFQNHVLQAFLENGADPDTQSYFINNEEMQISNRTPVFTAIEAGNIDAVKILVNYNCAWVNEFFNERDEKIESLSLLEWASLCQNSEIASSLIILGGDKNLPFMKRAMKIAIDNKNLVLLKTICNGGGDVCEKDGEGNTLLHVAAMNGDEIIINWLLKNELDWMDENKSGVSPYHVLHHYHPSMLNKWDLPYNKNYNVVSINQFQSIKP